MGRPNSAGWGRGKDRTRKHKHTCGDGMWISRQRNDRGRGWVIWLVKRPNWAGDGRHRLTARACFCPGLPVGWALEEAVAGDATAAVPHRFASIQGRGQPQPDSALGNNVGTGQQRRLASARSQGLDSLLTYHRPAKAGHLSCKTLAKWLLIRSLQVRLL